MLLCLILLKSGKQQETHMCEPKSSRRHLFQHHSEWHLKYSLFNYDVLEKNVHNKLSDFRVNPNREFFRYPLDKAISLLQRLNASQSKEDEFEAVDITELLLKKYPNHLKEDIVSVRIVQPKERVWLEITTEKTSHSGFMVDQTIKREDLAFICDDGDGLFFKREDHVQINARKFVDEFDPYSIIMTTDLFKEECCHKIDEEHRKSKYC